MTSKKALNKVLAELPFPVRRKPSKYRNKITYVDGKKFHSKQEAKRYVDLNFKQQQGLISGLLTQVKFQLLDPFVKNGKKFSGIAYIADFVYQDEKGNIVVEDVKGKATADFKLKRELFEKRYQELELKVIYV